MFEVCTHCSSKKLTEEKTDSIMGNYLDPLSGEPYVDCDAIYVDYRCEDCKKTTTIKY